MRIFLFLVLMIGVASSNLNAQAPVPTSAAASVPIFISDFELVSVPPPPNYSPPASTPKKQKSDFPVVYDDSEPPSAQARLLMDFFATTLMQTLQTKGYTAARSQGPNAPNGAKLRGVFAEPDVKNRIRRAILGGASTNPRFYLYVGIFNLARQDQPLYQLAADQPAVPQWGPVITLNNYIPLAKYEMDKNPTEDEVRRICAQIAANLTMLLNSNPNAFTQ